MIKNIRKKAEGSKGFTIVELLVVIVVIAILAAITIVSYGGVTNKAYTTNAQNAAKAVENKAIVYYTENASNWYPITYATLSATPTATWYLPANTITLATSLISSAPATTASNTVSIQVCGGTDTPGTPPGNAASTTKPFGLIVSYWNYSTNSSVDDLVGNTAHGAGAVTYNGTAYTTACNYALT